MFQKPQMWSGVFLFPLMKMILLDLATGENVDVFLISNGGSPEAAERIIKLLRSKYKKVRFLIAGNAYSAATMMCFAGDEIIMHCQGTLGPIDPQIGGIPAHSILGQSNPASTGTNFHRHAEPSAPVSQVLTLHRACKNLAAN